MSDAFKFKFSIVMSIYKTDKWLREAVDSIINQDIGFEENVQIIMVNDGSPDNSEEICLEYQKKYPNNIVYRKKKNGGLSSARNHGLKYREGEYVNFFDPDDILSPNTLNEVYRFISLHPKDSFALITIPLVYFEAQAGLHKKYEYMGSKNRIIALDKEPYNFILSSAGSFYPSEVFDRYKYDKTVHTAEDTDVNMNLFIENPYIGYVCERGVQYNYRKRIGGGSMVDSLKNDNRGLTTVIKVFNELLRKTKNKRPDFINQCIIYELRARIRLADSELFSSKEEYERVLEDYRRIIKQIPRSSLDSSRFLHSNQLRYMFYSCIGKYPIQSVNKSGSIVLSNNESVPIKLKPILKAIEIKNDKVTLDFIAFKYGLDDLTLTLNSKLNGKIIKPTEEYTISSSHDIKLGNHNISETTYIKLEIPTITAAYQLSWNGGDVTSGTAVIRPNIFSYLPFKLYTKYAAYIDNGSGVSIDKNIFYIYSAGILKYYKRNLFMTIYILKNFGTFRPIRLFSRLNKKYILINDRPTIAKDNGEAVFKYINTKRPDIAKNTYFVIDKKSPDYKRLKKYGKVVNKNSLFHKYLFLNSKLLLSSHLYPEFILPFHRSEYKYYGDVIKRKLVWLQHGITMNGIDSVANKYHQGVDGVVIAANIEGEIFGQDKYFYGNEEVIRSGFPRLDYNTNKPKNIITIIPTWRNYISGVITSDGLHKKVDGFEQTEFYEKYAKLLSDGKLNKQLEKHNVKINFILHPGLVNQADSFRKFNSTRINIVEPNDINYTKIFSETSLLVTDYSSVFFDFAYLYKPTLLYQFDREKFLSDHYKASKFFSYDRNAPGAVKCEHDDIVDSIINIIKNGFKLPEIYKKRIDKLFINHDKNNSKRLIDALEKKNLL